MSEKQITIFYSWQDQLPEETNKNVIRNQLRVVCKEIEKAYDITIVLDEATRDVPGSPDIPSTIIDKISVCDIFISDITTVNRAAPAEFRRCANSNVLLELGYAMGAVGWHRVVMLFNTEFGKVPDDVTFDIDRKRIATYSVKDKDDAKGIGDLKALLKAAIKLIIDKNPLKPEQLKKRPPEEIKRELDIKQLTRFFQNIHIHTLDNYIQNAPGYIDTHIFHYYEGVRGILDGSFFNLYDKTAEEMIRVFYQNLSFSLSHDELYRDTSNPNMKKLGHYQSIRFTADEEATVGKLEESLVNLRAVWKDILNYVREHYLEINIEASSDKALADYEEFYAS